MLFPRELFPSEEKIGDIIRYYEKDYCIDIYANGTKKWHKNGVFHRDDGPSIEWADGDKYWHKNGVLHREDGPAIEININSNRTWGLDNRWCIHGIEYTEEDFNEYVKIKRLELSNCLYDTTLFCRDISNLISSYVI